MNLGIVFNAVKRETDYLNAAIESMHYEPVVRVVEGSPQRLDAAAAWRIPMRESEGVLWGAMTKQQRIGFNFVRSLAYRDQDKACTLVAQDDVLFAPNWFQVAERAVQFLEAKHKHGWVLSLYSNQPGCGPTDPDASCNLCCHELEQHQVLKWYGAQALIFPERIIGKLIEKAARECVLAYQHMDDLCVRNFCLQEPVPLYRTCPTVVQHVGRISTMASVHAFHESPDWRAS